MAHIVYSDIAHLDRRPPPLLRALLQDTDIPHPPWDFALLHLDVDPPAPNPSHIGGGSATHSKTDGPDIDDNDSQTHTYPPKPLTPFGLRPRPENVQRRYQKTLTQAEHFPPPSMNTIGKTAPELLDVHKAYTEQTDEALMEFRTQLVAEFPKLGLYEDDWALQGFLTVFLKNLKQATTPGPADVAAMLKIIKTQRRGGKKSR
ncbi:hypothetical protein K438DRAFT_1981537 [Mycena galopus ATCC 62051]|nr:hypothetical protein K438DRAFT_1981537 [Mycena galopus ATCC 62051]